MRILFALLIACAASIGLWAAFDYPLHAPEWNSPVRAVTYSPSGIYDQAGLDAVTPERIKADLERLKEITTRVRTYTVDRGFDAVPAVAKSLGMKVSLGIWLSGDRDKNDTEIEKALAAYKETPDAVDRIFVGNEVILRGELTADDVTEYIVRVRKAVPKKIEVGYADVWSTWLTHPELADKAQFIGIHLLPYWEGMKVSDGDTYIQDRMALVRKQFPDKKIVIAETGWPSEGRVKRGAAPNSANEAFYTRNFLALAKAEKYDYYLLEAFDQPWKAGPEGAVGAYWGIYDAERNPKVNLTGEIRSFAGWALYAEIAAGVTFIMGLAAAIVIPAVSLPGYVIVSGVVATIVSGGLFIFRAMNIDYPDWGNGVAMALVVPCGLFTSVFLFSEILEVVLSVWRKRRVSLPSTPPTEWPMVSIHVPAHNEPPEMVIETLNALALLDYPAFEVILLDNNTKDPAVWQPVEAHCRALGAKFRFFHMEGVQGFKAGALNKALEVTDPRAQFIGVIDSDYAVAPYWLKTVMPSFSDTNVAIVQAPQDYRDAKINLFKSLIFEEYAGFFRVGMVERNEHNAIIQHGTMCVVRRTALDAVKGWSEWCICEDTELGLKLFEAGYKAHYTPRSMGKGLMPDTYDAYKSQRYRWVYGAMQIMKRHMGPIFQDEGPGNLTLAQRYYFIAGWLGWLADGFALIFSGLAIIWTVLMVALPRVFDVPVAALSGVAVVLFSVKFFKAIWIQTSKVGTGFRGAIGASLTGLSLGYTVGKAVIFGLFTSGLPFLRTPKMENAARVTRALRIVIAEAILFVLIGAAIAATIWTGKTLDPDGLAWAVTLGIMGLPYGAAVVVALVSSLTTVSVAASPAGQTGLVL